MPITAQLSRLVVYGLPLAFVIFSWLAASSLPDFLEGDHSFVSSLQVRDVEIENPRGTLSLMPRAMDRQQGTVTLASQLPSAPRLLHYLLLGAGLRDLSWHVLIISLLGTGVTVALIWRLFGHPALIVVPLAVVLDYTGFLAWTLDAARIWMFVLFFSMILAVKRGWPLWFCALAFCLIHLDFRIATFVGATTIAFALLTHHWSAWRFVLAGAVGAALPLAIFGIEVLAFYGWESLLQQLSAVRPWFAAFAAADDGFRYLYQAGHGPILLLLAMARDTHNVTVYVLVIGGIISALFALSREWIGEPHRFLAILTVSGAVGTIVASSALHRDFVESFAASTLPLASFLIAPALGVVALELRTLLGNLWRWQHLGTITTVVVLIPLVMSSVKHVHPDADVELMRVLPAELRSSLPGAPRLDSRPFLPGVLFPASDRRALQDGGAPGDTAPEGEPGDH